MPELPEAETIARQLAIRLAGKTVQRVLVLRRDIVHGDARPLNRLLPGRTVTRVVRRAKRVVLELDPAAELIFHLGMSGRLIVCPGTSRRSSIPTCASPSTTWAASLNPFSPMEERVGRGGLGTHS